MPSPQCPTYRHIPWLSKKGDLLFPILKSISLFSLFKWILHNQIMWQLVTLIIECQFGKWDSLRIYTWHIWTLRLFLVKIIGSMFLYKVCRPRVVNLNKKKQGWAVPSLTTGIPDEPSHFFPARLYYHVTFCPIVLYRS